MQASTPNQPAHPVGHGDLLDDLPGQPVIHSLSDEILCDVLYHLSIQDKQRAQIVCKRWHVILKHPPRGLWGTVTWDIAQLTPPGSEVEPNFNYDDDDEEPDYELARDDDRVLCGLQWLGHRVKGIERLRINVSGIHRGFRLADRYLPLLLGVLATDGGFPKLELWIARGDSADNILESDIFCVPMFTDLVVPNLEELNIDFGQLWLMQRSQLDWVSWLTSLRKLDLRADGHRRSDPGDLPAAFSNLTLLSEVAFHAVPHVRSLAAGFAAWQHNLTSLDLALCAFQEMPRELSLMTNLRRLCINECGLVAFPEQVCALSRLEQLQLMRNAISQLPESVSQLRRLRRLRLGGNQFTTFPDSALANMPSLQVLSFHQQRGERFCIDGPITCLQALTGLTHVWLKQVGEWEAQSAFHIGRAVMQLHRDFASGRRAILPYIQYLP